MDNSEQLAKFLFEVGSLRKIARSHRQKLLTDDMSDNIASHSFRVVHIGYLLAKAEKVDPYKVLLMCLYHDVGEARTGDINRTQKQYVSVNEEKLLNDQLTNLVEDNEVLHVMKEYQERISKESIVAKDADKIDQLLLIKEYAAQGVAINNYWFKEKETGIAWVETESAKKLVSQLYDTDPYAWWLYLDKPITKLQW